MSGIDNDPDGSNGPEPSAVFYFVVMIDRWLLVVVPRAAVGQDVSRGVGTNASTEHGQQDATGFTATPSCQKRKEPRGVLQVLVTQLVTQKRCTTDHPGRHLQVPGPSPAKEQRQGQALRPRWA